MPGFPAAPSCLVESPSTSHITPDITVNTTAATTTNTTTIPADVSTLDAEAVIRAAITRGGGPLPATAHATAGIDEAAAPVGQGDAHGHPGMPASAYTSAAAIIDWVFSPVRCWVPAESPTPTPNPGTEVGSVLVSTPGLPATVKCIGVSGVYPTPTTPTTPTKEYFGPVTLPVHPFQPWVCV